MISTWNKKSLRKSFIKLCNFFSSFLSLFYLQSRFVVDSQRWPDNGRTFLAPFVSYGSLDFDGYCTIYSSTLQTTFKLCFHPFNVRKTVDQSDCSGNTSLQLQIAVPVQGMILKVEAVTRIKLQATKCDEAKVPKTNERVPV